MSVGRDLLDLPFAELVRNLAVAIADGQTALDANSIATLRALADTNVDLVTSITEIIEQEIPARNVNVNVSRPDGTTVSQTIPVTGVRVRTEVPSPVTMSMLQAGLQPTFYQFTEATLEVRLSITMREEGTTQPAARGLLGLGRSRAYAGTVDFRNAAKYAYQASGSSLLRVLMRPVPAPARLEPAVITINALTEPPTVTRTPT